MSKDIDHQLSSPGISEAKNNNFGLLNINLSIVLYINLMIHQLPMAPKVP